MPYPKTVASYNCLLANALEGKDILGRKIEMDAFMGTLYFVPKYKNDMMVYCTPMWCDDKGIEIAWCDENGNYDPTTLDFVPTHDIDKDVETYVATMIEYIKNHDTF